MKNIKIFVSYLLPFKKDFAIDMGLSLLVALIDIAFPIITRFSLQSLLPKSLFTVFFVVMAAMFLAYILKAVFYYFIAVVGHQMGAKVEALIREDIFTHMQTLSFSFFDKNRTGGLLGHVVNDLFEIVELAHHGPEFLLTGCVTIIGAIIILFRINVPLTVLLMIMLPVLIGLTNKLRIDMQNTNLRVKSETGRINSAVESSISGFRTAKAYANEASELEKFREANELYKASKVNFYKAMGRFNGCVEAGVSAMQVVVIAVGGYFIMSGTMDYIDLITFSLYVATFTTPVRKMAQFMEVYASGVAGFNRFIGIMETQPEIKDKEDAISLEAPKGHIVYKDVCFCYENGKEVLNNINFEILPGKTYALVGPSGEGKTTLCSLLERFYEVTSGSISIDNIDIRDVTQKSLHENIGIIQQDVFIFAGTVMDNIRYGRPDATDAEVIEAAKLAEIHDEIMEMPKGYETSVGERGVVLSGGQKQRLSIARVILKNPPILILDEATSALDSVTEARIQKSLEMISKGRTCIIIAHRLSTIRNADCIAVIEDKSIIEQGSRLDLLAKNGVYARLEDASQSL